MNHDLAWWALFLGRLAVEVALLVALAGAGAAVLRAPRLQRRVWQSALLALGLLTLAEFSDLRFPAHRDVARPSSRHAHVVTAETPDTSRATPSASAGRTSAASPASPSDSQSARAATPTGWPGLVWLAGSLLFLARLAVTQLRLRHFARRLPATLPRNLATRLHTLRADFALPRLRALTCPKLRGPVAFGIRRPTLVLPADFAERFSAAQQEAMLAHELAHLAERDPLWRTLADVVVALGWWHPATWFARRQLQAASEAVADEAAARLPDGRLALAESLVLLGRELAAEPTLRGLGVMGDGLRSQLARRVRRLLSSTESWRPEPARGRWVIRALSLVVVGATLAAPWPGQSPVGIRSAFRRSHPTVVAAEPVREAATKPWSPPTLASLVADPQFRAVTAALAASEPHPVESAAAESNPTTPAAASAADTNRPITLEVLFANIQERSSDDLGLDWLFGQSPTNNPAAERGTANDLPGQEQTPQGAGLRVDLLRIEGQALTLGPVQFEALRRRLKDRGGVELIASPRVTTLSGRQAQVQVRENVTLVTGVSTNAGSATNAPSINYQTERVQFGPTVDVVPLLERDLVRLKITASVTDFLGYDDPRGEPTVQVQAPGAAPVTAVVPLPRVRVRQTGADGTKAAETSPSGVSNAVAKSGETVVLRGPLVTQVQRQVDKVAGLGDLPLVGRLFRHESTSTVRQRLYIFVTVTVGVKH